MEAGYSKHDLPPRCRPGAFLLLSCLNSGSVQISKPTDGEDTTDKFHILDKTSPQRKSGEDKDWEIYLTPVFVKAEQADTLLGKLGELTTKISSLAGTAESWT